MDAAPPLICRRCRGAVVANAESFEIFEQRHYTCFHYEFEHEGDPDVECAAGGCPAAGIPVAARYARTGGIDLIEAGNTIVPAILALEGTGYRVSQDGARFIATDRNARFAAEDPVALLGLVRLAETRRPWRVSDDEIDNVLGRFRL